MERELSISEARKHLPELVDEVAERRTPIVITRRGKAVARLVPCPPSLEDEDRHPLRGMGIWISDDFDEPMEDLWEIVANSRP